MADKGRLLRLQLRNIGRRKGRLRVEAAVGRRCTHLTLVGGGQGRRRQFDDEP
jgi:hypothetical protein